MERQEFLCRVIINEIAKSSTFAFRDADDSEYWRHAYLLMEANRAFDQIESIIRGREIETYSPTS